MKKISFLLIMFFLCLLNVQALDISSKNVIMYNLDNGQEVMAINADEKTPIASLTKIMTTLVAIEKIKNLDETVTITNNMIDGLEERDISNLGFKTGEKYSYEELLYGNYLASAGDASLALSISLYGSEAKFVKAMNDKAKDIGLIDTYFTNSIGMDDYTNPYSTVKDVAIVLRKALENELFKKIFETKVYEFKTKNLKIQSTITAGINKLGLDMSNIEIRGGKTGYTEKAGRCLASIAYDTKNGINYLLVTAGANTSSKELHNIRDAKTIYDYVAENYKNHELVALGGALVTLDIKYGKEKTKTFYSNESITYYSDSSFDSSKITLDYMGIETLTTNLKVGKKLGTVSVTYNGEVIKTIDIILDTKLTFSLIEYILVNIITIGLAFSGIIIVLITTIIYRKRHTTS